MNAVRLADIARAEASGQYWTPQDLAPRMAHWAAPRGCWLEPSCGSGVLVGALLQAGASSIVAIDTDDEMALHCGELSSNVHAFAKDFLEFTPPANFDGCLMNPPDVKSSGRAHVLRALELCPRVVVLHRTALLHGQKNHALIWSRHTLARVAHLVRRPSFWGPAHKGQTAQTDWSVFDILKGKHEHVSTTVEWWV